MNTVILQIDNDKGDGRFVRAFANIQAVQAYLASAYQRSTAPIRPNGRDTRWTLLAMVEIPDPDQYFLGAVRVYAADMLIVRYWNGEETERDTEKYAEVKEGGVYYVEVEVQDEVKHEHETAK